MTAHPDAVARAELELRKRLSKLVGMLGSDYAGERANAVDAINEALLAARKTWAWLAELLAHGEIRNPDREKLFANLVVDRLRRGLAYAFGMTGEGVKLVREIVSRCESDLSDNLPDTGAPMLCATSPKEIRAAVFFADDALRRATGRR